MRGPPVSRYTDKLTREPNYVGTQISTDWTGPDTFSIFLVGTSRLPYQEIIKKGESAREKKSEIKYICFHFGTLSFFIIKLMY